MTKKKMMKRDTTYFTADCSNPLAACYVLISDIIGGMEAEKH
jgi:hypothetical protein